MIKRKRLKRKISSKKPSKTPEDKGAPIHVAVIPDGNRRWARKRGFSPWIGHQSGMNNLEKLLEKAMDLGVKCFTFWGASQDNLTKRPKREVNFLYKVFDRQIRKALNDKRIEKNKVKVNFFGRWKDFFPKNTQVAIHQLTKKTRTFNKHVLTFLLAYNGTDEMINCVEEISKKGIKKVSKDTIKNHLWTKDLPPVDLVIRTGCEEDPHMSAGFMMWDTAYSQLYFTKTLFPAFTPKEFEKIIKNFSKRERRMGK
ncbi:MAG: polyprenyl diphosphate synthase [Candidatus Pacebacteria bacterium]|nr:polyprenyl diphosphate synthase [Candidatus Paceibacterota bacterium]